MYEALLIKEKVVRAQKQKDYDEQAKSHQSLKTKIEISRAILSSLTRKNTDGMILEPVANETDAKGNPKM